jgi:hypothetical protein
VLREGGAGEWLRGDVSEVLGGRVLDEVDSSAMLGAANHGVSRGYPFGLVGDATASGSVDEDTGIGVDRSGTIGLEAEFAEEDAETEDGFRAAYGLKEFSSTRGVADGGREAAGDHEAATSGGWFGVLESESAEGAAFGAVVQ